MTRCAMCRRTLGACEVTLEIEGRDGEPAELCEGCDADMPEQLRPSLGYVPALLASVEPRGCPTPGVCSAVAATDAMRAALRLFVASVTQRTERGNIYALGKLHAAEAAARKALGEVA